MFSSRSKILTGVALASVVALTGCSSEGGGSGDGSESYKIGINQLVQHPADTRGDAVEGGKERLGHDGDAHMLMTAL